MDIQRQGQLVEVLGSEMSNKYSVNTADSSANTKTHSFGGRFLISEPVVKFFHDGRELKISPNKDEDPYAAIARYVFELNDEIEKLKSELAKAQAVPEGFVLVPMVPSERMINAVRHCYEGEAYLPYSLYSEFVNQAIIERTEAQDPTND